MNQVYAIHFEKEVNNRDNETLLFVRVAGLVTFKVMMESYIFQHLELTLQKTGQKLKTSSICGVQKIPFENTPAYELRWDGTLREIPK